MYDVPFKYRVLDFYLKRPIFIDCVISVLFSLLAFFLMKVDVVKISELQVIQGLTTDLISVTISLAGFILAALTIIVTFKDSIDSNKKTMENAKTGKELFFSSESYFTSVRVFYRSAFELLFLFVFLSLSKLFVCKIEISYLVLLGVFFISLIALAVFRSLCLLVLIIKLQHKR